MSEVICFQKRSKHMVLPQIRKDCLKRGTVAVDVRYDCGAHCLLMEHQEHEHDCRNK
jgi:hypothetical protein